VQKNVPVDQAEGIAQAQIADVYIESIKRRGKIFWK
jgi:hypothetical protein